MKIIDFFIGLTLMNAMLHFILGTWKGRMLSGFGIGNTKNILYSLLNFVIFLALYSYEYGLASIIENGIVAGAVFVLVIFHPTGRIWYRWYSKPK